VCQRQSIASNEDAGRSTESFPICRFDFSNKVPAARGLAPVSLTPHPPVVGVLKKNLGAPSGYFVGVPPSYVVALLFGSGANRQCRALSSHLPASGTALHEAVAASPICSLATRASSGSLHASSGRFTPPVTGPPLLATPGPEAASSPPALQCAVPSTGNIGTMERARRLCLVSSRSRPSVGRVPQRMRLISGSLLSNVRSSTRRVRTTEPWGAVGSITQIAPSGTPDSQITSWGPSTIGLAQQASPPSPRQSASVTRPYCSGCWASPPAGSRPRLASTHSPSGESDSRRTDQTSEPPECRCRLKYPLTEYGSGGFSPVIAISSPSIKSSRHALATCSGVHTEYRTGTTSEHSIPPSRGVPGGTGSASDQSTCGSHGFVGPPLLPAGGRCAHALAFGESHVVGRGGADEASAGAALDEGGTTEVLDSVAKCGDPPTAAVARQPPNASASVVTSAEAVRAGLRWARAVRGDTVCGRRSTGSCEVCQRQSIASNEDAGRRAESFPICRFDFSNKVPAQTGSDARSAATWLRAARRCTRPLQPFRSAAWRRERPRRSPTPLAAARCPRSAGPGDSQVASLSTRRWVTEAADRAEQREERGPNSGAGCSHGSLSVFFERCVS
jgi:hypothetical protein